MDCLPYKNKYINIMTFEWDEEKNMANQRKHGVSFEEAQDAFFDERRMILADLKHSSVEKRWFCVGKTQMGIMTVRFTMRNDVIRIFGAGYWRQGRRRYEEKYIHGS